MSNGFLINVKAESREQFDSKIFEESLASIFMKYGIEVSIISWHSDNGSDIYVYELETAYKFGEEQYFDGCTYDIIYNTIRPIIDVIEKKHNCSIILNLKSK